VQSQFRSGLKDGIPIALGYLSVSFGFGILAVRLGLTAAAAVGISASNLTSAGQVAGVGIIAAGGTLIEMALTQLVINLRYALMSISLSQKLDKSFGIPQRLLVAYGITDEIFAVASHRKGLLQPRYMYGLILISFLGWTLGTLLGACAGQVLPQMLTDAMGIVLYGMFLAIIVPVAREERGALAAVCMAALLSTVIYYLVPAISAGFSVILCSIAAAAVAALLFPIHEETEAEEEV